MIDLTGQRFGYLTVLSRADKPKDSHSTSVFWLCQCDCGTQKVISSNVLRQGKARSCGCQTSTLLSEAHTIDMIGKKFGNLIVLKKVPKPSHIKSGGTYYECKCDCGNNTIVDGYSLRSGRVKSCGCHIWQVKNLTGNKYGKLTVIAQDYSKRGNGNGTYWICQCECGNYTSVQDGNLKNGNVSSCGCLSSKGEFLIEKILKENNYQYIKQYSFKDLVGLKGGLLRFDFAIFKNDKLSRLIEFQGEQHYDSSGSQFFNTNIIITDKMKKDYCKKHKIQLVCIPYWKRNTLELKDIIGNEYLINDEELA